MFDYTNKQFLLKASWFFGILSLILTFMNFSNNYDVNKIDKDTKNYIDQQSSNLSSYILLVISFVIWIIYKNK